MISLYLIFMYIATLYDIRLCSWFTQARLSFRAQEVCESGGGRPGLPSLLNLRFLWT